MNKKFFGVLAGSSTFGVLLAGSLPLPVLAQQQNSTSAVIAAEESAQQAAATATIAAEEAAQQASTTAVIAAEEAAQQAATTAVIAAEEAAQQAATTAVIAAEEAAQQAATTAVIAAEEAAQQAATTATIAAEEAAQQAATTATIAAEEAAQQAATTAVIAAEEAAQQAATTATIAAEEAAQQAATTATIAAEEAAQQAATTATIAVEGSTNLNSGSSLHFGSEAEHYTAPNSAPVEIIVGGELSSNGTVTGGQVRTVNPGESVTAAEMEAIEHIMLTGAQSLLLNSDGHAVGGHVTLTSADFHSASDLYVPEAVSLSLINFNPASPLTVADNASILGSVYAFHDTHGVESVLNFGSLNVESTGLLSGGLPTGNMFGGYFASSGLTISATTSVVNAGTINSPGALAVNAGTTISNTGAITGSSVTLSAQQSISNAGTIQALTGSLNLNSASGQYINSGMMSALNNINVATTQASQLADINFDNSGGVLDAANDINVRDLNFAGENDVTITGGDVYSDAVNIYSGHGKVRVNSNEFTGTLNSLASETHAYTSTENFYLGNITNTGDPTFFNDVGNIVITGNITVAEALTIAARGNITDNAAGNLRIRAGDNTQGYDITLAAGVNITPSAGATSTTTVPGTQLPAGQFIQMTAPGAGQTGGNITLTQVRLETRAIGGSGARPGGDITLVAYAGNNGQGNISLTGANSNTQLDARGRNGGASGTVTVIGEGNVTPGRILANVTNGTGDVTVASATAIAGPSGTLRALPDGSIVDDATLNPANFTVGAIQDGDITFNLNVNSRGDVLARTNNGDITVNNPMRSQSNNSSIILQNTGGDININSGVRASNTNSFVSLQTTDGNVNLGAEVRSDNSFVSVTTTNGNVTRTAGRLRAVNVNLTATNGNIGTAAQRVRTRASSGAGQGLTINTGGDAFINERDSVRLNASSIGGQLDLETNQSNGFVRIDGNVNADNGATITTVGTGIFRIDTGNALTTTNQNINITADDYIGFGSLNAGSGNVNLNPNGNGQTINFGAGGGGTNFRIDSAEVGRITAGSLNIGTAANTGGIINSGNVTVPGTINNVVLTTSGTYNSSGGTQTIVLGTANLTINANGINTDTITGGATNVTFNSTDSITFTGSTTLAAAGSSINATATNDITSAAAGTISGATVSLVGGGNIDIGADVSATAGNLVVTSGNASTSNIGAGVTAQGDAVVFTTPNLTNSGTIQSNAGDVDIVSNGAGNALVVNMSAGSSITSSADIEFNTSASPGSITMNSGNGSISANAGAGNVILNGGAGAVNVNVASAIGCIRGSGTDISITSNAATSDLNIGSASGNLTASGNLSLNSGRDVNFKRGTTSAGGLIDVDAARDVTVGSVAAATLTSTGGNIDIDATRDFDLTNAGSTISTTRASGNAGNIDIQAGNDFTSAAGTVIEANGTTNGDGGTINLAGSATTGTGQFNLNTPVNAAGAGNGNGGTITATSNSSLALNIAQVLNVDAGSTGNGGSITLRNTGNGAANGGIVSTLALNANASGATGTNTGGTITIDSCSGAIDGNVLIRGNVSANGAGNLNANGGTILIEGASVDFDNFGGFITVSANAGANGNGGTVTIRACDPVAGDITTSNATNLEVSANAATGNAGDVTLDSAFNVSLSTRNSFTDGIQATTTNGNGGTVTINAGNDILSGILFVDTSSFTTGDAGLIDIDAGRNISENSVLVLNSSAATGNAGRVFVDAVDSIGVPVPFNPTTLFVIAQSQTGDGGTIRVNTGNHLVASGNILANSQTNGNGGTIRITGSNTSGAGRFFYQGAGASFDASGAGTGNGGSVTFINDSSDILGFSGDINVNAGATSGNAGTILVQNTGNGAANGGIIAAGAMQASAQAATGTNTGGTITVDAKSGAVDGSILIRSSITANGSGDLNAHGGTIRIEGTTADFDNFGGFITVSANSGANGNGGTVTIRACDPVAGDITTSNGTNLEVSANAATGNAGDVTLDSAFNISLSTRNSFTDGIQATSVNGNGGTVSINAGNDILSGILFVDTSSTVTGNGGLIDIDAGRNISENSVIVLNSSASTGDAGRVFVDVVDSIGVPAPLNPTTLFAIAQTQTGDGGTIRVNTGNHLVASGNILANSQTNGNGGTIRITGSNTSGAGRFFYQGAGASFDASGAGTGNGGSVTFINNSSDILGFSGVVNVNAGATSGNAGTILVQNTGNGAANGGIFAAGAMQASAQAATGTNTGGTVTVDAFSGAVDGNIQFRSGISANGSGNLNANGGTISVQGAQIDFDNFGGTINVNANGGTNGDGGAITLTSTTGSIFTSNGTSVNINSNATTGDGGAILLDGATSIILGDSSQVSTTGSGTVGSLTVRTPQLTIGANSSYTGTGDILVQGTGAGNQLNVAFTGANGIIVSNEGNVTFNAAGSEGQITITGGLANGTIAADGPGALLGSGIITINGGNNPVNVSVNTLRGCVTGFGNPFNIAAAQSIIAGNVLAGAVGIGNINATTDFNINAPSIIICAPVAGTVAGVDLSFTTTDLTNGTILQLGAGTVSTVDGNINYTTTTLDLATTTTAGGSGVINIQGNTTGTNAITTIFNTAGAGSALIATNGAGNSNINFNPVNAGPITITGGGAGNPNGLINAGANNFITYNGSAVNPVAVAVNQIIGCNTGTGSTFSLAVATGSLDLSNINASGVSSFTNTGGDINVKDNSVVQTNGVGASLTVNASADVNLGTNSQLRANFANSPLSITTGTNNQVVIGGGNSLIFGHNAAGADDVSIITSSIDMSSGNNQIAANVGNVSIDRGASVNPLVINFGSNSIVAATGNVIFNQTNNGSVTLNGAGEGFVGGTEIIFNGAGGLVVANLDRIVGCIHGTANSFSITTDNTANDINIGTAAGDNLTATAGGITLNSARDVIFKGGTASATALIDVDAVRDVTIGSSTVQAVVRSTGGNIDIDAGGAVTLERTGTSNITSVNGQVDIDGVGITLFNDVSAGTDVNIINGNGDIVIGGRGGSTVTAGTSGPGNVVIVGTGNASDVLLGGTAGLQPGNIVAGNGGSVSITLSGVNADLLIGNNGTGSITADGNINIDLSNGDAVVVGTNRQGTILSNNGNITINARGRSNSGFHDIIVGRVAGAAGSSVTATNGTVSLTAVGTNDINIGLLGSGTVSSNGDLTVNANGGSVSVGTAGVLGSLSSTNGNVDIDALNNFTQERFAGSTITANNGQVDIDVANGRISISNNISAQGNINLATTNGGAAAPNDGRITIGDAGNSTINSTAGNININSNGPDADILIGNGGAANLQANGAGGTVTINAVGTNSDFFIGGTQNSTISANGNIGVTTGDGLFVGNGAQGSITSTNGNITLTANGASGEGILFGRLAGGNGVVNANNGSVTMNATTTSVNVGANGANSATAGTTMTVNAPRLDVGTGDSLTAAGNVLIQGTGAGNSLAVNFNGAGAQIVSTGANVTFNDAGSSGAITVTGGASGFGTIAADGGGVGAGNITFNGGNNPVDAYANEFRGCVNGTGSPFNARANTGTVNGTANTIGYGTITSDQTINLTGPNVFLCGDVTTTSGTADVNVTTSDLTNGTVIHGDDSDIDAGRDASYNTTRVVMNTDASTTAARFINVQGNTTGVNANSITFDFAGANTSLVSNNAGPGADNINFNPTNAGQITITGGPGNGLIDAGAANNVTYNGNNGTNNDVAVNVNQIIGCNTGDGNNVSITTVEDLFVGPFVATGTASFVATGAGSDVATCGNITAAGAVTLDAGTGDADVIVNNGHQVQGSSVQFVSGTGAGAEVFIGDGNASVTATTGDVTITTLELDMASGSNSINATLGSITVTQPNAALLNVSLGSGSSINANNAGQDITFNGTGINIAGAGEGTISANDQVVLNGGAGAVNVNADRVDGCITGTAVSHSISTDNATADLNIGGPSGPLTATAGDITLVSGRNINFKNGASANASNNLNATSSPTGSINLQNSIVGSGNNTTFTSGDVNFTGTSLLSTTNGAINFQSNAAGGALDISLADGRIEAQNNNINFNPTTAGQVTVTGSATSSIFAGPAGNGMISYNSAGNDVSVQTGQIDGMNTGAANNASFDVLNGTLQIGPFTAANDLNINQVAPFGVPNSNVTLKDTISVGGNFASTAGPGSVTRIGDPVTGTIANVGVNGTSTFTTSTIEFHVDGSRFDSVGDINIQSNNAALFVNSIGVNNTSLTSTNGNINFNQTTAGQITILGTATTSISAGNAGAPGMITYNSAGSDVLVQVGQITGMNTGTSDDASFDVVSGTFQIGPYAATGNMNINQAAPFGAPNSNVTLKDVITVGGNFASTAGPGSLTNIGDPVTGTAADINVTGITSFTTSNIVYNVDNSTITSGGDIFIQSNNAFVLVNSLGATGSTLTSTGGDINFNQTTAGQVTVLGSAGAGGGSLDLSATNLNYNGGAGDVLVDVNSIAGCNTGNGDDFRLNVDSGLLEVGAVTAGEDAIFLSRTNNINFKDDVTAVQTVQATTVAGGIVTIGNNADVNAGTGATVNTGTLTLVDLSTLGTTNGDVIVQSNAAGGALRVNLDGALNRSQIFSTNGNIGFNTNTAGQITVNNSGNTGETGSISTGTLGTGVITFNGGTNSVNVDVNRLEGCVGGSGNPFYIEANEASVNGTAGVLGIGNIISDPDITVTTDLSVLVCAPIQSTGGNVTITTGTGAGNFIQVNDTVTAANDVNFNTGNAFINSIVTATNGSINIQSSAPNNTLNVLFQQPGAASALVATSGTGNNRINFNPIAAGRISIDGGGAGSPNGLINAGLNNISYNGNNGTNNDVTVAVNQTIGCHIGDGNNIAITTTNAAGDILVGNAAGASLNATGTLTLNSARDVIFKGGISTTNGPVDIDAARDVIFADGAANASLVSNGTVDIDAVDGVIIGQNAIGSITSLFGSVFIDAGGASGSGTNDLVIGENAGASGSFVQANVGSVNLVTTGNNSEVQVGDNGDGSVLAGGTVSITTTGAGSDIDVGDNNGSGAVSAGGDITFSAADGVTVGDDSQGTVRSTNGNISITANDDSLVVADEAGANGSFIRADNGNVTLLANGPNTDIEIGDTGNGSVIASGSISATTTGVNGDIKVGEDTGATGNVNAGGDITFNANDGVSIGEDGVGTVTSTNGNVSITANGASGFPVNDLSIGLNAGSDGSAVNATNGNVTLITTGANSINVGTGGNASVTAGNNFIVNSASDVNLGNTGAGTTGTVTANNGTGAITSGSGNVNIANNSNAMANGNLNIDGTGTTALNVNMGTNAFVTSTTGSVSFQQAGAGNEGQITISGGTINSANCIDYHVGPNPVSVDVEAINSPVGSRVLSSGANPTSIFFQTQSSDIGFCPGADLNTSSIGAGGPITITANNGMVDLNGNNVITNGIGNGGPINISGSTGIVNGGTISANSINGNGGPITLNGGTGNVQTGDINSTSINGNGGNTNVTAGGNINTGSINVSSINGNAGNITTNSGGDTNTGTLFATSTSGNGGNINSTSGGDLTTGPVLAFANGGGTGGSFTGTANNGTISVGGVINVSSTNGQGGNVTTTSQNVMIGGGINLNGGTNGGILDLTTTNPNIPLVIGGGGPNSINGNVSANGTNGNGGTIMFTSNDLTQNAGNTISANGGQNGGVVTFNPQDPGRPTQVYNINGVICAEGTANPNTGVVGFGAGGGQNMNLTVGATGNIKAGQQITLGNLVPNTGLPQAPPSGLIRVSPQPGGSPANPIFANPPFSTPLVVVNGTLFFPPPPPTPPDDTLIGARGNPFASLLALLALQNANQNLFIPLMPRDQTELSGYVRQDEEKESDPQVNRVLSGCKTFASNFASGNNEHQRLSKLLELGQLNQDGLLDLKVGNAFVSPQDGSTSVKTNDCQVLIAKNAGVFISEDGNDTAIFNLHQRMPGGVKIVVGNKMIDLPPGRMLLVSRQGTKNFNAVKHQAKIIGYRNPSYYKVNKDIDVFVADFSIPSAMMKIKPLREMSKSKDRTDKKVFKKLLMNAVLLQEHSRGRGRFMTPPGGLFNQQSGGI